MRPCVLPQLPFAQSCAAGEHVDEAFSECRASIIRRLPALVPYRLDFQVAQRWLFPRGIARGNLVYGVLSATQSPLTAVVGQMGMDAHLQRAPVKQTVQPSIVGRVVEGNVGRDVSAKAVRPRRRTGGARCLESRDGMREGGRPGREHCDRKLGTPRAGQSPCPEAPGCAQDCAG